MYVIKIQNLGSRGAEYAKIFDDNNTRIVARFTTKYDADTAARIISYMRNDSAFVSATVEGLET